MIIILRWRKNIKICLMFLSSICLGMHRTLDVRICIYRVWKDAKKNTYLKIVHQIFLGEGKTHLEKLLPYTIWEFQYFSINPWLTTCFHNSTVNHWAFLPDCIWLAEWILLSRGQQTEACRRNPASWQFLYGSWAKNCSSIFKWLKVINRRLMFLHVTIWWNSNVGVHQ